MKRILAIIAALAVLLIIRGPSQAQEPGYRVIVHNDNPTSTVAKSKLSQYFLRKDLKWEHGTSVDPVDLGGDSSVREAFSLDVHGRSVSSIEKFWQRQIFSGRGVPPPEVGGDRQAIDHVRNNAGAIGYVSPQAAVDQVKVLTVVDG